MFKVRSIYGEIIKNKKSRLLQMKSALIFINASKNSRKNKFNQFIFWLKINILIEIQLRCPVE